MLVYWVLVAISILAGVLAVLYLPLTDQKRIQRWLAVEILGALIAAGAMWILLKVDDNPVWRKAYAEFMEKVHGKTTV